MVWRPRSLDDALASVDRPSATRVLHAIGELGPGGAETLVIEMARLGPDVGWHTSVGSSGGSREHEVRAAGSQTLHIALSRRRPWRIPAAVASARRALRAARPDVVVAHNVSVTVVVGLAMMTLRPRSRAPIVTVFHGVADREYRLSAFILDLVPTSVVVVSDAIGARLKRHGLDAEPVVVPNAVAPLPVPERAKARAQLGLDPDRPVALCLARLVEQKRHDVLLRAWARLDGDPLLLVAGDGPLRAEHEALARELGLQDRVSFLGARADVPDLLGACDVTVLSSDWEGLPVAILESMSAARPVVATDVDGVREAVGEGGLLVPPDSPVDLATALEALLSSPDRARRLGELARERVRERHDPAAMMRAYDAVFSATLAV